MLTIEHLESSLERVHEWIRAADQKVSVFLAFQGVVLTILFPNIFAWTDQNLTRLPYFIMIPFVIGVTLVGYSLCKSGSAIIPRLSKGTSKKSLTYFGDIAKFKLKDFHSALANRSPGEYEADIIEQIHVSSMIAARKHSLFRGALLTFFCGMTLLALCFLSFRLFYGN